MYFTNSRKPSLSAKTIGILVAIQIAFSILCIQGGWAQETADPGIPDLRNQLNRMEEELKLIDKELARLSSDVKTLKREIEKLKEEPRGFFSRIRGIFSRRQRKLESSHSKLLELSDRVGVLQNRRKSLVEDLVALANQLIDKSDSRMTVLMEVVRETGLNGDLAAKDAAQGEISDLWQLAEITRETRNRYALPPSGTEPTITFPPLRSDDPEDIRLGIAILRDAAAQAQAEVIELGGQIEELESRKRLLEFAVRINQNDEERGSVGVEDGNAPIPWGLSDAGINREIDKIGNQIKELSDKIQKKQADAKLFEEQIERQQASQRDATPEGRPEDD